MANLTHWKKLSNPNYLGAYSIENGKDIVLTIRNIRQEEVIGTDGKKEECIVCYWVEPQKPMILNATNAKMIQKLLGTPYIEQWAGHKVQIGIEKVKAFGDVVEALRIRKFLPKAVDIKCTKCKGIVTAANNLSAEQLAKYTEKKYGSIMCAECATKAAQDKPTEPRQEGADATDAE